MVKKGARPPGTTSSPILTTDSAETLPRERHATTPQALQARLRRSEERFRELADATPVGIFRFDDDGRCHFVNRHFTEITGYGLAQVRSRATKWMEAVHSDDRARVVQAWREAVASRDEFAAEFRMHAADGRERWVRTCMTPVADPRGRPAGSVGSITDITVRVETQRALAAREAEYRLLAENSSDFIALLSTDGTFRYCSPACRWLTGQQPAELLKGRLADIVHPDDVSGVTATLRRLRRRPAMRVITFRALHRDGHAVWCEASVRSIPDGLGNVAEIIAVTRDVTERKRIELQLQHQGLHDPLTGLPNRTLFLDRLDQALSRAKRHADSVAVLVADLDRFEVVNDSMGHAVGDRVLVDVAERVRDALRPGDTVARFGGDEFTILCEDVSGREDAVEIAQRVAGAIAAPLTPAGDGREVFLTVSTGIALAGEDQDADDLVRDADAALYRAKDGGDLGREVFDAEMRAHALERIVTDTALRHAIERKEFRLHYQPIVSLETGAPIGVEALVRWQHPERGTVGPREFIALAVETGLIIPIGTWVIEEAARQAGAWQEAGGAAGELTVSVNLSARQLTQPDIVEVVDQALRDGGADPGRFMLELTESAVMEDAETCIVTLDRLRALGVRLSIDDFGTGYSSLAYLKRFPVSQVKVDRSFVDGIGEDAEDSQIVTAIVSLARALGLQTVAEGVETPEQLAAVRRLGCDAAQGFLFARPRPASELAGLTLGGSRV